MLIFEECINFCDLITCFCGAKIALKLQVVVKYSEWEV